MARHILFVISVFLVVCSLASCESKPCSRFPEYRNLIKNAKLYIRDEIQAVIEGTERNKNFKAGLENQTNAIIEYGKQNCNFTLEMTKKMNFSHFFDLIEFSLLNETLIKKLHDNNGFTCIKTNKDALRNCAPQTNQTTPSGTRPNNTKYGQFMKHSKLTFNSNTCSAARKLQTCMVRVLEEKCKETGAFVSSLFDFLFKSGDCQKRIDDIVGTTTPPSNASNMIELLSAYTSLIVSFGVFINY